MRRTNPALALALALAFLPLIAPTRAHGQALPGADPEFRMALVGDAIITRRLSVYEEPEFLGMIELLRGADAAFANLEMLLHDYEPYPMYQSGGTYMRGDPFLAKELVWAGIDLVSMANNHTGDYGVEGMRLTRKYVAEAGLVGAGVGEDLFEAREAKFLETAHGRVALISVASTFPEHSAASAPYGAVRGRPGLNPLHFDSERIVTQAQIDGLRTALADLGLGGRGGRGGGGGNRLNVFGTTLVAGEEEGTRTTPDSADVAEIAAVVSSASRLADYVIVAIHAHEASGANSRPAEFLVTFARAMIDAGADMFVGHGPHVLRGIEIRNGKPIFYSLGDFMFQNETLLRLPNENYAPYDMGANAWVADFNDARYGNDTRGFPTQREIWESVVAVPTFQGERLVSIELHPITLGFGKPTPQRGRPMLATGELAQKIINDLTERSAEFGTRVEWRDGIGVVVLDGG